MRPTTAPRDNIIDFNSFLHPGTAFEHPRDLVSDPNLNLAEKRAVPASWASDASAIASCPSLRAPEGLKAPVFCDGVGPGPRFDEYSCRGDATGVVNLESAIGRHGLPLSATASE